MGQDAQIVNVVTCIDGIIAAYKEGGAAIQKLKAQHPEGSAAPVPTVLEQTVADAPEEIQKEKERGIRRFGHAFEDGDHIAVISLQHITIQLQRTLLEKLSDAAQDIQHTEFSDLIDAAETGRDKAIRILLDLKQRLLKAQPWSEDGSAAPARSPTNKLQEPQLESGANDDDSSTRDSSFDRPPLSKRISRVGNLLQTSQSEDDLDSKSGSSRRARTGSVLGFLRNVRRSNSHRSVHERSAEGDQSYETTDTTRRHSKSGDAADKSSLGRSDDDELHFTYDEGNESYSQRRISEDSSRRGTRSSLQTTPDQSASSQTSLRKSSIGSALPSIAIGNSRTPQSPVMSPVLPTSTVAIRTPKPENNYLGYCKGAWKLQNGDKKAMQKSKEFNDGWAQSSVYCLTCTASKCAFAGHMSIDIIWSKIWTVQPLGLRVRWAFLAKSHVPQQKAKEKKFLYQCMFCAFQGLQTPLQHGTDAYLEHVSREHRGRPINDVVLHRTCCVTDHICEDSEEFDINLFPLSTAEQAGLELRMRDEALAAREMNNAEKQDSMFSEPWNEGLSEFHYGGEMEATEKEC